MADEKIRLVLSTSGGQDVKDLEKHFVDLAEALGVTDIEFEKVTEDADNAKKKVVEFSESLDVADNKLEDVATEAHNAKVQLEDLARTTGATGNALDDVGVKSERAKTKVKDLGEGMETATGTKGSGGRGLGGFAYAMQDLAQGGFPAVLNNVQQLAAGVGLGAGLAGALQLAGVGIFVFGEKLVKLSGLIDESIKPKLGDLTSELNKQAAEVKRLKDEYDKLIESEELTLANRAKLRNVTEDLTQAEAKLAEEKAAASALEKADKQQGVELDEKTKGQKQSFKEKFVDTGQMPKLKQELMRSELEKNPDLTDGEIRKRMFEVMANENGTTTKEAEAQYYGAGLNLSPEALAASQKNTNKKYKEAARQQLQSERGEDAKTRVGRILDAFQNAKTQDELDKAFQELAQISPARANELREYHTQRLESEALDEEVEKSSSMMKEQRASRDKEKANSIKSIGNMDKVFGAYNKLNNKANTDAEKARAREDKKERTQEQKDEDKRQDIRDKAMERMGVTPEGLAVQRQNSAVGNSKSAQSARQNTAQQQEQALLQRFQNDGMTAEQAKKTTDEIGKIGKDIVQTMLRTGAMDLTMFKQLQMTAKGQELQRMKAMQEMRAGIRQPGFQGGNQAR